MTLRGIVGRILPELTDLAEHDTDAVLHDALHDVADPAPLGEQTRVTGQRIASTSDTKRSQVS